jgi:hypothetical protein
MREFLRKIGVRVLFTTWKVKEWQSKKGEDKEEPIHI